MIRCFAEAKKPKTALSIYSQMCRRGISPNAFVYMSVLKALVGLRDGYSAYQIIQEMRQRKDGNSAPDMRHYSMAIFAAVVSNRCAVAEELYKQYILSMSSSAKKVDVALCSLYLRSLLQQGKWEEGKTYLRRMETESEEQQIILSRPNDQTYHMLLQFQILDEHYDEAMQTFNLLYERQKSYPVSSRFLEEMYESLGFALGSYSSTMQQRYHRDTVNEDEFKYTMSILTNPSSSPLTALTGESIYYCQGNPRLIVVWISLINDSCVRWQATEAF